MKTIGIKALEDFISKIFNKAGLSKEHSVITAKALVYSDAKGVWSHGVARTSVYCKRLDKGIANKKPNFKIKKIYSGVTSFDADNALGLVSADYAIKTTIQNAKENGIAITGVFNSNHFGRAALYLEQATKENCLAWIFTNASKALPPHGAMAAHFGTSPFAFGCPTKNVDKPFLLDMASSSVARGKLKYAAQRGEKIPFGLALDKDGKPTDDGFKAFEGIMLPFGGMKGAGISWMMDIVAGIFTGAAHSGNVKNAIKDFSGPANVGHTMIVVKADLFQDIDSFLNKMETGIETAKKLKLANGFDEILHPGEPEYKKYKKNLKSGIQLSDDVIDDLKKLCNQYSLDFSI